MQESTQKMQLFSRMHSWATPPREQSSHEHLLVADLSVSQIAKKITFFYLSGAVSPPFQSNEIRPIRTGSSPVSVPIENNRAPKKFPMAPIPNRLPMTEDPSDGEPAGETAIMRQEINDADTVSAAPKPQPRTLPPMPTREGTFQSINTRFLVESKTN